MWLPNVREAQASDESIEAFAKRGASRKVREATLAAMRDRMFEGGRGYE